MVSGYVVEHDPLGVFTPGDYYTRGEIALWLEEGDLPIGLQLRNHRLWTVADRDGELVLQADGVTVDPHTIRTARNSNYGVHNDTRERVLQLLADMLQSGDRPPTRKELAQALGIWPSAVTYHLDNLQAAGLVERDKFRQRCIWLTDAGARMVGWPGAVRERE